jgi:hypothetical protein
MTDILGFSKHPHGSHAEPCLACEIFALIGREFLHLPPTTIARALVEALALVAVISARDGREEAAAAEVGRDVVHVARQVMAEGLIHQVM